MMEDLNSRQVIIHLFIFFIAPCFPKKSNQTKSFNLYKYNHTIHHIGKEEEDK